MKQIRMYRLLLFTMVLLLPIGALQAQDDIINKVEEGKAKVKEGKAKIKDTIDKGKEKVAYSKEQLDSIMSLYDTIVGTVENVEVLKQKINAFAFSKKKTSIGFEKDDQITFTINLEKKRKFKFFVFDPNDSIVFEEKYKQSSASTTLVMPKSGDYRVEMHNKSLGKLKATLQVNRKKTNYILVPKPKEEPEEEPETIVKKDTLISYLLLDEKFYLSSQLDIQGIKKHLWEFDVPEDTTEQLHLFVLVGVGRRYTESITNLIGEKTMAPVSNPILARLSKDITAFPVSDRIKLDVALTATPKGSSKLLLKKNEVIAQTYFKCFKFNSANAKSMRLEITNVEQVSGKQVHVFVMAINKEI